LDSFPKIAAPDPLGLAFDQVGPVALPLTLPELDVLGLEGVRLKAIIDDCDDVGVGQ